MIVNIIFIYVNYKRKILNKIKIIDYLKARGKATIRELSEKLWINNPAEFIRLIRKEKGKDYILTEKQGTLSFYILNKEVLTDDK